MQEHRSYANLPFSSSIVTKLGWCPLRSKPASSKKSSFVHHILSAQENMPDLHNRVLASRITFYLHRFACRHMLIWSKQTKPSLWHLSRTTCYKSQPATQLPANPQCAHIPGAMSAAVSPTTFLAVMFSSLGLATLYISCPSVCFALCYIISIAIAK